MIAIKLIMYFIIHKVVYCQTHLCALFSEKTELLFRVRTIQIILTGKRRKQIEKFRATTKNLQ